MKNSRVSALLALAFVFSLQACGLKGELYLEQPEETSEEAQESISATEAATAAGLDNEADVDNDPLSNESDIEPNPGDEDTMGVETAQ